MNAVVWFIHTSITVSTEDPFLLGGLLIFLKKDRDGPCQFLIVESSLHGLVDNVEFHLVHSAYFHLRASGEKG